MPTYVSPSNETLPTFFWEITSFVVYLGSYNFCAGKIVFGSRSAMEECNGATVRPSCFSKI